MSNQRSRHFAHTTDSFTISLRYTWIRDSSLVYKLLIDQFTQGQDSTLQAGITAWVSSMKTIQQVTNPSGSVSTGGLGEPKFNINQSAFTGSWGCVLLFSI